MQNKKFEAVYVFCAINSLKACFHRNVNRNSMNIMGNFYFLINSFVFYSAGIGRTGVLILMETAMCLIEANEPVYPLDIVRSMRDQRAMLIQTTVSLHFYQENYLFI